MKYDAIAIGMRAYNLRHEKRLTQVEISDALGIHQTTYSKFENGNYDMPISQLIQLCIILDVSVSWLIGENIITHLTDSERRKVEKYLQHIYNSRNT